MFYAKDLGFIDIPNGDGMPHAAELKTQICFRDGFLALENVLVHN